MTTYSECSEIRVIDVQYRIAAVNIASSISYTMGNIAKVPPLNPVIRHVVDSYSLNDYQSRST